MIKLLRDIRVILIASVLGATTGGTALHAGHRVCDPAHPNRPPCEMGSCAQMGPDGKPNGHKCSSYCAKGCCGCGTTCTVDYPGEGPSPDEQYWAYLYLGE